MQYLVYFHAINFDSIDDINIHVLVLENGIVRCLDVVRWTEIYKAGREPMKTITLYVFFSLSFYNYTAFRSKSKY